MVTVPAATATDNCGVPTVVRTDAGPASGSAFPIGTTNITYNATDASGNTATCQFSVVISDVQTPSVTCGSAITQNTAAGTCAATVTFAAASGSDNCDAVQATAVAQTSGSASGSSFALGSSSVEFTGTDAFGNTATCTRSVTVVDNEAPTISCPASAVTATAAAGTCQAAVTYTVTGADNCGTATLARTSGLASGGTFSVGTTSVGWQVTDGAGLTATCSFDVVVSDTELPSITCPSNVTATNVLGSCGAVVTYSSATALDNCAGMTLARTTGADSGTTFAVGTHPITYTATDAAGNANACTFYVIVTDSESPTIDCPDDIAANTSQLACNAAVTYTAPVGVDNCDSVSQSVTTRTVGLASGATFGLGSTTVTYDTVDGDQQSATCNFVVTVSDFSAPTITCPSNIIANTDAGVCTAAVTYTAATATDNCGTVTVTRTAGSASGSVFNLGVNTVTYSAEDTAGNVATCSFTITVHDNEAPQYASCPSNTAANAANGQCSNSVTYVTPVVSDNCGPPTTVGTTAAGSGSTFSVGTSQEVYVAQDAAGNTAYCNFTVTVSDTQDPTISCPASVSVNNAATTCGQTGTFSLPTFSDNCAGSSMARTAGQASGTTFAVGYVQETYTVTDAAGRTASCSFNVTVLDTELPTISCPSNIMDVNEVGYCGKNITYAAPTAADNCQTTVSLVSGQGSGGFFSVGSAITEQYRVVDPSGNSRTCSFTVTILDTEAPTLTCPSNIAANNTALQCGATVSFAAPVGQDNCGTPTTSLASGSQQPGSFFAVGTTVQTYTAVYRGLAAECTFNVTVSDVEAPRITCPADVSISTGAGVCTGVATFTAPVGVDNCGGSTTVRTVGPASGSAFSTGATTVTYVVTDAVGLQATCSMTVTVTDQEAPEITCPANIAVNTNGQCSQTVTFAAATATDNCGSATVVRVDAGPASGAGFPVGVTTVEYVATDSAGLTAQCNFTVTVTDNVMPTISCPASMTVNSTAQSCAMTAIYTAPTGSHPCLAVSTARTAGLASGAQFPLGTSQQTFVVTDILNRQASCSFDVVVQDVVAPAYSGCPADVTTVADAGVCTAAVSYTAPTVTDNCQVSVSNRSGPTSGSAFSRGATTVLFYAEDAASLSATCQFVVTVSDTQAPVVTCPANIAANTGSSGCTASVTYSTPTVVDNCEANSLTPVRTAGLASGASFPVGATTVTYTATDQSGNVGTCSFTVTVTDNSAPVLSCPSGVYATVNASTGVCTRTVTYPAVTSTDNCGVNSLSMTSGLASGAAFPVGTTTLQYDATDVNGLSSSCTFSVVVRDREAPAIACPAAMRVNTSAGLCEAAVTYTTPVGTDNCAGASTTGVNSIGSGGSFPLGVSTETYVVSASVGDAGFTVGTCSFTVTVSDAEAPVITCPSSVTVQTAADTCAQTVTYTAPVGTDNCAGSVTSRVAGNASGASFGLGTELVQYRVSDGAGTNSSCSFTVTVQDQQAPVVTCPASTTTSNEAGQCTKQVTYTTPTVAENCPGSVLSRSSGLASGSSFPVGVTTVCHQSVDTSNNAGQCCFNVTVEDTEAPAITCPAAVTTSASAGVCYRQVTLAAVTASDNCVSVSVSRTDAGPASGTNFAVGSVTLSYVATDSVGLTASCSYAVVVQDTEVPTITCPANITVGAAAGQCSAVVTYAAATASDNCGVASVAVTSGQSSGSTFNVGSWPIQYTATDTAGNTNVCQFYVTVEDLEAPVITCPAAQSHNITTQCGVVVTYADAVATDNCLATVTRTSGTASGQLFAVGSTSVVFQAVDAAGNSVTCTSVMQVNDVDAPEITCPANITVQRDPLGTCYAAVSYTEPVGADECSVTTVRSRGLGSGATFHVGETVEEYTATDASGNIARCTVVVKVLDQEQPSIVCDSSKAVANTAGQCGAVVTYTAPVTSDNCNVSSSGSLSTVGSGSFFPVGVSNESYVVLDVNGNRGECWLTVTVTDTEQPAITCPSNVVQGTDAGVCTAAVSYTAPVGTDNCASGVATSRTGGLGSGATFSLGTHQETYMVQDAVGLQRSCSFNVVVEDLEAPAITCPSDISLNTAADTCANTISYTDASATDNCGTVTTALLTSSLASGSSVAAGSHVARWNATDGVGLTSSCTFNVVVTDNQAPTLTCPSSVAANVDLGVCGAAVSYSVTHTDNCAGSSQTRVSGPAPGATFAVGSTSVSYTATDSSSNTQSCSFQVTVTDNELPAITCPASISRNTDAGLCSAVVTYTTPVGTDNCDSMALSSTTRQSGLASGAAFPVGSNTVQYRVQDGAGNQASCSFAVTVADQQAPTLGQ